MGQAAPQIDKQHIEASIHDWESRVAELYSSIEGWLKETAYEIKKGPSVTMHEEMMRNYGVGPREMETRHIFQDGVFQLAIVPKALWVIGANGRLDILGKGINRILVDYADRFSPPQWKLVRTSSRMDREDFSKEVFLGLLS